MFELKSLSDEDLMKRLQNGEAEALIEIYGRHSSKVWSYLLKKVPRDSVEDLFQDTFVKLVEKKVNWSGQPFVLWLYVVLRHLTMDFYRDEKLEKRILGQYTVDSEEIDGLPFEDIIANMPPETSKLLTEYFKEGWSYKELAEKYNSNEVSLRKRLSRAINLLKKDSL